MTAEATQESRVWKLCYSLGMSMGVLVPLPLQCARAGPPAVFPLLMCPTCADCASSACTAAVGV